MNLNLNPLILNALETLNASNFVVNFPEDIDNTSKFLAENESLICKIEHLELENKKLKEENIKLKSHIYNFDNVSESGDKLRTATGLTVESFNNLTEFLNQRKDSCNIKFYDTSSRLSQVQSQVESQNCQLKISCSCMTWLKNGFACSHWAWYFKISKSRATRYLMTWINFCHFSLGAIPVWSSEK